jgi:hypothetical protein
MCPSVSVLTGESAERNTFMGISSTDDIGDGTSVSATILSLYPEKKDPSKTRTLLDRPRSVQCHQDMRAGPRRIYCYE